VFVKLLHLVDSQVIYIIIAAPGILRTSVSYTFVGHGPLVHPNKSYRPFKKKRCK